MALVQLAITTSPHARAPRGLPMTTMDSGSVALHENREEPTTAKGVSSRLYRRLRISSAPGSWLPGLPLLVCIALFLFHLYKIGKYAVNLPFLDEWGLIYGNDHPASINLKWLYE